MLIDFSDALSANMYRLGGVYLRLCALLKLDTHPLVARPVDPSLYIHRFTDRLGLGEAAPRVAHTALRLLAAMKRDWLQTGRRPAGVCGAALFVAAAVHGEHRSKAAVMAVVHVAECTLTKRIAEFGATDASALTPDEFAAAAQRLEGATSDELARLVAAEAAEEAAEEAAGGAGGSGGGGAAAQQQPPLTCVHAGATGVRHSKSGMVRLSRLEHGLLAHESIVANTSFSVPLTFLPSAARATPSTSSPPAGWGPTGRTPPRTRAPARSAPRPSARARRASSCPMK